MSVVPQQKTYQYLKKNAILLHHILYIYTYGTFRITLSFLRLVYSAMPDALDLLLALVGK